MFKHRHHTQTQKTPTWKIESRLWLWCSWPMSKHEHSNFQALSMWLSATTMYCVRVWYSASKCLFGFEFELICFALLLLSSFDHYHQSNQSDTVQRGRHISFFVFSCKVAKRIENKVNTTEHNSNNNSNNNYNCAATFHNNLVFSSHVSPVFHLIESKRIKNCMQFHFNFNLDIYQPNGCARNQIHTHMHSISTLLKAHPLFPSVLHWMYECRLQSK